MRVVTYVGPAHRLDCDGVVLEHGVPTEVNEKLAKTLLDTMPHKVMVEGFNEPKPEDADAADEGEGANTEEGGEE